MSGHIDLAELRTRGQIIRRTVDSVPAWMSVLREDEVVALVEAVEAAQAFESLASYDFYPDSRVEARVALRKALAPFARPPEGGTDGS